MKNKIALLAMTSMILTGCGNASHILPFKY